MSTKHPVTQSQNGVVGHIVATVVVYCIHLMHLQVKILTIIFPPQANWSFTIDGKRSMRYLKVPADAINHCLFWENSFPKINGNLQLNLKTVESCGFSEIDSKPFY